MGIEDIASAASSREAIRPNLDTYEAYQARRREMKEDANQERQQFLETLPDIPETEAIRRSAARTDCASATNAWDKKCSNPTGKN